MVKRSSASVLCWSRGLLAVTVVVGLVGCGGTPDPIHSPAIHPSETAKNPSDVHTASCDPKLYPCGPFGYQSGDVIPNVAFTGRLKPGDANSTAAIKMSDFFQDKSVKLVALLVAAEWCGPCQQEQGELVDAYAAYKAKNAGVAFFEVLTESTNRSPADLATVDRWTAKKWTNASTGMGNKLITFPVGADPSYTVVPLGLTAYPTQILIQTSDMTIQVLGQGYGPGGALESNINSILGL
jgi:hypothetical protein